MPKKDTRRKRRSIDERIAELESKISEIRTRESLKQARRDPALRHVTAAIKALEKAREATDDSRLRRVAADVRSSLTALLSGNGAATGRTRRSASELEDLADTLLSYVRSNPGQRGEEIAAAMGLDAKTIRPVMKRLISAGKVTTEGQRRGTTYAAV